MRPFVTDAPRRVDQPAALRVGQFQPRSDRFRRSRGQERSEPPDRIWSDPRRRFAIRQHGEPFGARRVDLGQHRLQDAVPDHLRHHRHRAGRDEQLEQFGRDALTRQRHQVVGTRGARVEPGPVDGVAESRVEAEEAQDAQVILGNALQRVADEADAPRCEVREATEPVEHLAARRVGVKRIHGEIAPCRVLSPIIGKGDYGMAAVGRNIAAQRRHLDGPAGQDRGDGAMGDAGRDHADAGFAQQRHRRRRLVERGDVNVGDGQGKQRVANATADEPRLPGTQRGDQRRHARAIGEGRSAEAYHRNRRDRLTIIPAVAPQMRRSPQTIS